MKRSNAAIKPNIKFSEIRTLEGKQDKGFEELSVQLLPMMVGERLQRLDRIEGRGGDGGVESIAFTVPGQHVGLQSKFFTKLDATQWRQVDESVKTAIDKHPELTRYFVCVPLDRTPGQLKKWTALVASWHALNSALVVDWVGYSELLRYLLKPEAGHILTYWFSYPQFSLDWVARQTEVAIEQLHDRYTPQLHQNTSAEVALGFWTASEKARAGHRQACSKLVIAWRHVFENLPGEMSKLKRSESLSLLQQTHDAMLKALQGGSLVEQGDDLIKALTTLSNETEKFLNRLFPMGAPGEEDGNAIYDFRRNSKLDKALHQTEEILEGVKKFSNAKQQSVWVLTGEAGSGKSHLLASLARSTLAEGRACLLVVGERFASQDVLGGQIPALVDWNGSMRDLLACLSMQAAITGNACILMVDAINESPQRGLWRRELPPFVALVKEFAGIRLLVSCRSDCLDSSIPPVLLSDALQIKHHGFDLEFHAAVTAYFDGYKVTSHQFPTLNAEFQNPLFLKTLCEAYRGRTLPLGPVSFVGVLTAWEARIAEEIETRIDCPCTATQRAVAEIISTLATSDARRMRAAEVEAICLRHFAVPTASQSLYRHLNSEGLLQEIEAEDGTQVRLQYERFSDVRIAQVALENFLTKEKWLAYWHSSILPNLVVYGQLDWAAEPQLFAYALLLPDAVGLELVECPIASLIHDEWARSQAKGKFWSAWLDALAWRILEHDDTKIVRLFALWANNQSYQRTVWVRVLQFSCVPAHPLNADFLHRHLLKLELPQRELSWTVPLALESSTDQTGESIVAPFLYWADASAGKASDEQVRLAATVLLWLTSSPNRELRDRATDIAIRILVASRSGAVCVRLLEAFWEVNDPYVKERLLAVMCGVLPYLGSLEAKEVSEFVLSRFWQQNEVAPHILQREYAAFIVRHACATGALPSIHVGVSEKGIHKSKPVVWTEEQVQVYDADRAYGSISSSLVPEEMGHYGDFGRYVMGSAVHHFVDDERADSKTFGLGRGGHEHDARFARRYIWQCIIELGWTPDRYADFERGLGYSGRGRDSKKIERISKKYQWIGLHEYLGHLSDALLFQEWNEASRPLRGAWELHARDYDPGAALGPRETLPDQEDGPPSWWDIPNPVLALDCIAEKQNWVSSAFSLFEPYLTVEHKQQKWIVLKAHLTFDEEPGFGVERFKAAQMSQWIDVRVFLIPKSQLSKKLKVLRGKDFFGDGCEVPEVHQCWISEYPWHPAFAEIDESCRRNETWVSELRQRFFLPVCEVSNESKHVLLPAPTLHRELGAVLGGALSAPRLTSNGAMEIHGRDGRCIFRSSSSGGRMLMVNQTAMLQYMEAQSYALVWALLAEKSAWNGSAHVGGISVQSAVYVMDGHGHITGGHTVNKYDEPEKFES
ncbi:ATP-binding protein [Rhodoferax sp.]|uniref:ATP-binding protein n=1 Tax=Rhodoferax sp. TaxID=50421 RepID=UPI00284AF74B|nr:ATP-binding protein [Rhodoferax sp.]MDR3369079.1 ATP-binding protein [Rhodoferax sp.]